MVDALTGNAIGVVRVVGGREKMKETKQKCGMKKANIKRSYSCTPWTDWTDWTGHSSRVPAFLAVAPGLNFFNFWMGGARGGLCICVPSIRVLAVCFPIGP